jgi:hypothetical protein
MKKIKIKQCHLRSDDGWETIQWLEVKAADTSKSVDMFGRVYRIITVYSPLVTIKINEN